MTHKQYTENSGISQRTAAYRFARCGVGGYSADKELTQSEVDALAARFGGAQNRLRKVAQRSVSVPVTISQIEPQQAAQYLPQIVAQKAQIVTQTKPQKSNRNAESVILFFSPFAVTLISIALTVCGLYMFAGLFGIGLGLMFGLFLFAAALVARNNQKGDTSADALQVVLWLELGACILHVFTFHRSFGVMGVNADDRILWAAATFCSGFVAFISYSSVMLIRNYNAE